MPRPVKWSRDIYLLRETTLKARTETWSRQDIERLFAVGRASAQSLMKAIGAVETIGAAHFVSRQALLGFLDEMVAADSVENALRLRLDRAAPPPRRKLLRTSLPNDLRQSMLPDLPSNVKLSPGRIEITANTAIAMVEALVSLAMVMQNDLARWEQAVATPVQATIKRDEELTLLLSELRKRATMKTEGYRV